MLNPLILCDLACVSALCIRDDAGGATVETLAGSRWIGQGDRESRFTVARCSVGLWSVFCSWCGITMAEWGDGYGWGSYLCAVFTIFVFLVRMLAGQT